jgi:hypothetical protein
MQMIRPKKTESNTYLSARERMRTDFVSHVFAEAHERQVAQAAFRSCALDDPGVEHEQVVQIEEEGQTLSIV